MSQNDYISHFGILGMKWGVRRYQNGDGSLTAAGRNRYGVKGSKGNGKSFARYNPNSGYSKFVRNQIQALGNNAKSQQTLKKDVKQVTAHGTKKSDIRLKLEAHYKKKGLSDDEAAKKADTTIKTAAIIGGVAAVGVGTAIAAKKYHDYATDIVVGTSKTPLYRVQQYNKDLINPNDAIFSTYRKGEAGRYLGNFKIANDNPQNAFKMNFLKSLYGAPTYHNLEITYNDGKGAKIASNKNAKSIYKNLYKSNKDFRDAVSDMTDLAGQMPTKARFARGYNRFNINLGGQGRNSEAGKMYIDAVKKAGYNGVRDINDQKYSGLNTKGPVITFGANAKVKATQYTDKDVNSAKTKEFIRELAPSIAKVVGVNAAIGAAGAYANNARVWQGNPGFRDKANARVTQSRARSMYKAGVPADQIAKQLGISESSVYKYANK